MLGREGADDRTLGRIYMAVVQSVFLYGLETLVITPRIGRDLGGFQHTLSLRLMISQLWRKFYGRWIYPPLVEEM